MSDRLTCCFPVSSAAATPRVLQKAAGTAPPPAFTAAAWRQQAE